MMSKLNEFDQSLVHCVEPQYNLSNIELIHKGVKALCMLEFLCEHYA